MKELFDYQSDAIKALYQYWPNPRSGNGIIVIPTGGGKSLVIAKICQELHEQHNARILILTHVAELIEQDYEELKEEWPEAPAGIYSAGLSRKELFAPILFAGIQSLEKHTEKLNPPPDIIIIDEAHLISRNDESRYRKVLTILKIMNPDVRIVGLTATHYRLDSGFLHKGENAIFDDVVYNVEIQRLIDGGYLVPVIAKPGNIKINTDGVHTRGGEFISGELEGRAMFGDTTEQAVKDMIIRGADRQSWLVFTTGIKHCEQVRDELEKNNILCEMVTGKTPKKLRERYVEEHKSGAIRALVCVDTLTTGYNNRRLDMIGNLRPTKSSGLWVQMLGRGTRTFPGKENCLLLDYTDNAVRIGPIDAINPEAPTKGSGVAPGKECPGCNAIIAAGFRICPFCGHEFPPPEPKVEKAPADAPILKSQEEPKELDVVSSTRHIHQKEGRPDSVRIEYLCGNVGFYREWVFPERTSDKQAFFYGKFMSEAGIPYEKWPKSAAEFLDSEEIPEPKKIWVKKDGKYWRILKHEY